MVEHFLNGVVHFLNGVVKSNKVDSIFQNLKNSKPYDYSELDSIYRGIENINFIMNNIDDSVAKVFTKEELPDKEIVRRVLRLW